MEHIPNQRISELQRRWDGINKEIESWEELQKIDTQAIVEAYQPQKIEKMKKLIELFRSTRIDSAEAPEIYSQLERDLGVNAAKEENEYIEQQIQALIAEFKEKDFDLFKKYISLPNQSDVQPEIMQLRIEYGDRLSAVSDRVEETREALRMYYDDLRRMILEKLEK